MTSPMDAAARAWWDWMWPMAWQVALLATAVLVVTLLVMLSGSGLLWMSRRRIAWSWRRNQSGG